MHQIQELVNFGTLQKQLEKHQIPLYMNSRRKKVCQRLHTDEVGYNMLDSLDKVENGFQTLYHCLRETQYSCPQHKLAADILKNAGKQLYSVDFTIVFLCVGLLCMFMIWSEIV